MANEIQPPAPVPSIDPWRTIVELTLAEHDRRLRAVESAVEGVPRIEKKLDEMNGLLLRVLDREATREPTQERELGNVKLELAKQSARVGGKWGAISGIAAAIVAAVTKWLLAKAGVHLE